MSVEPPIRCAVLVEAESGSLAIPHIGHWSLLHVNCDIAEARAKAEEWAKANIGRKAVLTLYEDHALSGVATTWAKP